MLRLQTHVYILAYRNPYAVGKMVSTLDVVSGGRVTMGVGTGHLKAEFSILGMDYDDRHVRTDQGIRDMRAAWSGEPTAGHRMLPTPVQRPAPPIWIGGNSHRSIRRAVELGDGWAPMPNPRSNSLGPRSPALERPDDLRSLLDYARRHADAIGRTAPFEVAVMPAGVASDEIVDDALVELAQQWAAAGATYLVLRSAADNRRQWIDRCRLLGTNTLSRLADIRTSDPLLTNERRERSRIDHDQGWSTDDAD